MIEWVQILKPKKAMLKFRCLHTYEIFRDKSTLFFEGDIFIQPWAPQSSTESRVICDHTSKMVEYSNLTYEQQFFYHNDVVRIEKFFKNPINRNKINFDTAAEIVYLTDYLRKIGVTWKSHLPLGLRVQYLQNDITKKITKESLASSRKKGA